MEVEVEELGAVVLHVRHRHGARRGEHEGVASLFLLPDVLALGVVALGPRLDGFQVIGEVAVELLGGRQQGHRLLLVGAFLCEHDHRLAIAGFGERALERHRVGRAAVEQEPSVDVDHARHHGQACRGAHVVELLGQAGDLDVIGLAERDVAHHGIETRGVGVEGLVVKGIEVVLHLVVEERGTYDVARLGELVGAHVALVVAKCQVDAAAAAELARQVVRGHEGAGRHAPCRGKACKAALHEDVEHAGGKDAAKAAAFKYERNVVSHGASLSAV